VGKPDAAAAARPRTPPRAEAPSVTFGTERRGLDGRPASPGSAGAGGGGDSPSSRLAAALALAERLRRERDELRGKLTAAKQARLKMEASLEQVNHLHTALS
jgi:hypothetical protein